MAIVLGDSVTLWHWLRASIRAVRGESAGWTSPERLRGRNSILLVAIIWIHNSIQGCPLTALRLIYASWWNSVDTCRSEAVSNVGGFTKETRCHRTPRVLWFWSLQSWRSWRSSSGAGLVRCPLLWPVVTLLRSISTFLSGRIEHTLYFFRRHSVQAPSLRVVAVCTLSQYSYFRRCRFCDRDFSINPPSAFGGAGAGLRIAGGGLSFGGASFACFSGIRDVSASILPLFLWLGNVKRWLCNSSERELERKGDTQESICFGSGTKPRKLKRCWSEFILKHCVMASYKMPTSKKAMRISEIQGNARKEVIGAWLAAASWGILSHLLQVPSFWPIVRAHRAPCTSRCC